MATTTITAAPTAIVAATTPPASADWHLAHQRAQERIVRIENRRGAEAASRSPIGHLLGHNNANAATGGRPAFRVGQLDTELLDEELLDLLKGQLWGGLKYFRPSIKEGYEPEFLLLLRAALFKLTIWDHNATYGAALQNLVYTDARRSGPIDHPPSFLQKSTYGLLTVGGRYLFTRLNLYLLARSNPEDSTPFTDRISRLVDSVSTVHSALSFVSFTAFLLTGHYRTLLDRALRMRLVSPSHIVSREVSFEYLNRQLVWHAFTEFLLFILPLIRVSRWRRWWARVLRRIRGSNASPGSSNTGELSFLPERTCAICHKETDTSADFGATGGKATDVVNPYEAVGCGHIYCYVCLAGKIEVEEGDGWACLRCATVITRCRPWRGGLKGLTGVGDWGEEVVDRRKVGFDDGREAPAVDGAADHSDDDEDVDNVDGHLVMSEGECDDDDIDDDNGTERGHDDYGSEDTTRPRRSRRLELPGRGGLWAEESFDDSVYNTADGDSEDDGRGR